MQLLFYMFSTLMSLKDGLRLKLKVKTKISLCMPIMLDHPWQSSTIYIPYCVIALFPIPDPDPGFNISHTLVPYVFDGCAAQGNYSMNTYIVPIAVTAWGDIHITLTTSWVIRISDINEEA